jgi:hypothetical protein
MNTTLQENSEEANSGQSLSDAERENLLPFHPVLEREYLLPTPMMKRAYKVISDRVWSRRTGAVFYASPRTGKTRCAMAAKSYLEQEFPKIHVTLLSARRSLRPTDAHMFRSILDAEQHVLSRRYSADMLFDNLVGDLEIKTKERAGRQYVLLIDELQVLNDTDLQQLVSLHNALELKKIKMTTISFAQPEILHRRSALMASNDRQIIARFLSEPLHFNGCSSCADLRELLLSFDLNSEFPEGSGWSYTRFFLPMAFEHGFRLATFAAQIWHGLVTAAGTGDECPIPMEHTCLTIENLLLGMRNQDCINLVLDVADIEAAVASSQLRGFNPLMTTGNE